jgi:DNA-binding NarL/FixJ family response regulator
MKRRTVYIIWTHPLFYESIRMLMNHRVEIVGSSNDHGRAGQEINQLQPEIVIIEAPEGLKDLGEETISILRRGPKVIHLSLDDNELSLYLRKQKTMVEPGDLMQTILSNADPANQDMSAEHGK